MEPEKKKKFNFGTGEIDVDQWLQDIDAGLNAYYSDIDKTYHKEEAQAVRNAMTNLIGRISNGDMMSRSANGMYNFKSQLYSPERGKYDKWAHLIALNYIGNKGRTILSSNTSKPKEEVATKPKYTPLTLTKRFNNSILRGAVNLNLDDTWWGTATNDERVEKLVDFLNKEALYVRGSQDISDVGDMYGDLGREGLAAAMESLATKMNSDRTADYGKEFGNLGMNNILKKVVNLDPAQTLLSIDEQLAQLDNADELAKKLTQLGWRKNKTEDSYFNSGYNYYQNFLQVLDRTHSDRASGRDVGYITNNRKNSQHTDNRVLGAVVGDVATADRNYLRHFTDQIKEGKYILNALQLNWEDLFTNKTLRYKDDNGNDLELSQPRLWYGLATLMHQMPDKQGQMGYTYIDNKRNEPIKVGDQLYYIPGTYRKTGDILLMDTYNKRLVKSSIAKYPSLQTTLGDEVLYLKEGGILKALDGATINNYQRFGVSSAPSQSNLESYQTPPSSTSNDEAPQVGEGNAATITALLGDMASLGLAYSKNPVAKKISKYTNVVSGVIGAYGDAKNGTFGGHNFVDMGVRLGAALPGGSALRGALYRGWLNKLSSFAYANSGLIAYGLNTLGSEEKLAAKIAWRKVFNGLFTSLNSNDYIQLGNTLNIILGTATANKHRAVSEVQRLAVAGKTAVSTLGKRVDITEKEIKNLRGNAHPTVLRGADNKKSVELQTTKAAPNSFRHPISSQHAVKTWPYITPKSVDNARIQNWSLDWWGAGRPTRSDFQWVKDLARKNDGQYYFNGEPNSRRKNDLNNKGRTPRKLDLDRKGGILKNLRGGVLKYDGGGKTGIQPGTAYNWYNNVFTGYKQHILDGLKTPGYADWLNSMQGQHSNLHREAGANYDATAYSSDNVGNYQTAYLKGFETYDLNTNPYNTSGIGQAYKVDKHYDFGTTKRDASEVDWENGGQFLGKPDKLYSQMTDDRRILGRKGDWTPEALAEFNKSPQMLAAKLVLELDPNDEYYKLKPINEGNETPQDLARDQETERTVDAVPQSELKKPFDPRALLIMGRGATNILANDWMFDRMLDRQPLWYSKDFIDRKLDTIGDYAALASAGNLAADLRTIQQLRLGSDQSLNIAADFEAGRIGREVQDKARLQDANKLAATHEAAIQVDMKDLEDNRDTAFINRKLMHDYLQDRFDLYNAKDKARVDSITGVVNNLTSLYAGKYLEEKAAYEEAKKNIMQTPREYAIDQMLRNNPELYKKVADATASSAELAQYNQLLSDYLKEGRRQYSADYFSLYGGRVKEGKKLHGEKEPKARIHMDLKPISPVLIPNKLETLKGLDFGTLVNLEPLTPVSIPTKLEKIKDLRIPSVFNFN